MQSYFKSAAGKTAILDLYNQKVASFKFSIESKTIENSFGKTHLLIAGEAHLPALLIVHGSNGCAPLAFQTYPDIHKHFRVYAVDVPAQPNKTEVNRLNMKDLSYGEWLHSVIEHLQLKNLSLAGFSFGGLVALKAMAYNSKPFNKAYLTAPAYIVNGNPLSALFKVFIPMKRFIKTKDPKYLSKFLQALFSEEDDFARPFLTEVLPNFELDFTPIPTITQAEADKINCPITLIAAEKDLFFPGKKMIKRMQKIMPRVKTSLLLQGSKHVQTEKENRFIVERMVSDLEADT